MHVAAGHVNRHIRNSRYEFISFVGISLDNAKRNFSFDIKCRFVVVAV